MTSVPGPAISWTSLKLPAAELGEPSPLPAFESLQKLPPLDALGTLPPDMRERIAYGRLPSPLPYAVQDGYGRDLPTRTVAALQLRNDQLTATVLPQLGGRIWSLWDADGDDLVFENPQLAFGNMALTNAWFAGGVEWNPGSTGHATTTARPVFAAEVDTERGPVLRLWEWERTRDLVFQIDLCLPPGSPLLLASIRVRNPDQVPKPLYWWTNIAVAEHPGMRVVAPAGRAWRSRSDGVPEIIDVPLPEAGLDISYPLGATWAADYFFQVTDRRPWIAALQADGSGLVHCASALQSGRKMFVWGSSNGGEHWQQWLCGPRSRYLEVQAGLARTQLEHLQIDAGAEVSWTEVFAPVSGDATRLHGPWAAARAEVEDQLEQLVGSVGIPDWHAWWRSEVADRDPARILAAGSGAGRTELLVRGRGADDLAGTPFGPTDDPAFEQLERLVRGEAVDQDRAGRQTLIPPVSALWEDAFATAESGWWSELMIAIRAQAAGDPDRADAAYAASLRHRPTAWAARGRALVAAGRGESDACAEHYAEALALAPSSVPLLVDAVSTAVAVRRPRSALGFLDHSSLAWSEHGRLTLLRVQALLAAGEVDQARELVDAGFEVADLREGESLEAVWDQLYTGRPLPYRYDYRLMP